MLLDNNRSFIFPAEYFSKITWFSRLPFLARALVWIVTWPIIVGMIIWFGFRTRKARNLAIVSYIISLLVLGQFFSFVSNVNKNNSPQPQVAGVQESKINNQSQSQLDDSKQGLIAQATTVNQEISFDSNLEAQDIDRTKQANLAVAELGLSTKDKKLFEVLSIIDAGTIKVSELGTLKVIGINPLRDESSVNPDKCSSPINVDEKAKEWLQGKKVYLEFDPTNRIDKYGRTLAYIYLENGFFYNLEMIKQSFARAYTIYDHPRSTEFEQVQSEAEAQSRGIWSNCADDTENIQDNSQNIPAIPSSPTIRPVDPQADELPPLESIPQAKLPEINSKIEPIDGQKQ